MMGGRYRQKHETERYWQAQSTNREQNKKRRLVAQFCLSLNFEGRVQINCASRFPSPSTVVSTCTRRLHATDYVYQGLGIVYCTYTLTSRRRTECSRAGSGVPGIFGILSKPAPLIQIAKNRAKENIALLISVSLFRLQLPRFL
jgi:hypothetical protein